MSFDKEFREGLRRVVNAGGLSDVPPEVRAQLEEDAMIYGNGFAYKDDGGQWTRLDPTRVCITQYKDHVIIEKVVVETEPLWSPSQEPDRFVEKLEREKLFVNINTTTFGRTGFAPHRMIVMMRGLGTLEEALNDLKAAMKKHGYEFVTTSEMAWDDSGCLVMEHPLIMYTGPIKED